MRRRPLHDHWSHRIKANLFAELQGEGTQWTPVTLPHDAMIGAQRSPDIGPANAYYPGGTWEYRRTLAGLEPGDDRCVVLDFEGVYRDAVVLVNGVVATRWPGGYSRVQVPIDHLLRPGDNEVRVEASAGNDSRWYSGAGIHRDVWLLESGRVHLAPDALFVRTPEVDHDGAVVTVDAVIENHSTSTRQSMLRIELVDGSGAVVGIDEAPVTSFPGGTVTSRRRLFVADPHLWGLDDPYLYRCRATLVDGEADIDADETTFGIRRVTVDAHRGLRLNGEPVLLRGACVHHDNGLLGSAAIGRADERRVERLKAAGFNALRSAHNPMARTMLDACDRLGVLVMDETFDMWAQPKTEDDYARRFADHWEQDVEAMVRNARNHPCVVMYSIGNEIPDGSTPAGLQISRSLAAKVRALDDTRIVTQAITGILVGGQELFDDLRANMAASASAAEVDAETGVNTVATSLGDIMQQLVLSPVVDAKTVEAMAHLDVAGYNYMESRYRVDAELHPERVIVGTETHPPAIAQGWAEVLAHPSVIGDFTWTGWDYLGEAGVGRTDYREDAEPAPFHGEFPWRTAWCGDVDITGHRRPQSYFREVVFGLRTDPYMAVLRPSHQRRPNRHHSPWAFPDVVSSWSWPGHEGEVVQVDVYAAADEVELVLDGQPLARQPAGAAHGCRATFEIAYEPGVLEAIAWTEGAEVGRTVLRSASSSVQLDASADRAVLATDFGELTYVELSLVDEDGIRHVDADRSVDVVVEGAGVLQGLGSANPICDETFTGTRCTTFDGRALAIIRPTGPGSITVTATAEGCAPQKVHLDVVAGATRDL